MHIVEVSCFESLRGFVNSSMCVWGLCEDVFLIEEKQSTNVMFGNSSCTELYGVEQISRQQLMNHTTCNELSHKHSYSLQLEVTLMKRRIKRYH